MAYTAPVEQIEFILNEVVSFPQLAGTEVFAEATPETVTAILSEAGKLAGEVIAPVNRAGDLTPARLENGKLRSSPGYAEAFRALADGGWIGVSANPEHGGMGLPQALNMAVMEMVASGCLALQLNPLLTQGQIEALEHHGSDELKALYLPKL
ncbi:MAG TPA: acyl-CoA dehydrogenase family protein, partial [Paracoccus sp. (in: a-proteobacteria)]|nr:acyl-CoA dehydrogenase family protein [Paracoccus sp. (in: a-proteobacteria)]